MLRFRILASVVPRALIAFISDGELFAGTPIGGGSSKLTSSWLPHDPQVCCVFARSVSWFCWEARLSDAITRPSGTRTVTFKCAPGDAIAYPSTTLHEVVPVRSGQRLVSITFVESYIADPHQRTTVYELNEIAALEGLSMKWENRVRLDVVRQNLMRMWAK